MKSVAQPKIGAIGSMKGAIEAMISKEVELTNHLLELKTLAEEGITTAEYYQEADLVAWLDFT